MATASVSELTRPQKLDVGKAILSRLQERAQNGPPEEALDAYITLTADVVARLTLNVEGKVGADAARKAQLFRLEKADSDVDTLLRHHESYLRHEANRRIGPNVEAAKTTYDTAFPHGISFIDDYIPDENQLCRDAITVLRSKEHAPTVQAIGLPSKWTTDWEAALDESDEAFEAVKKARETKSAHVGDGQDAEDDFVELMIRLRRYLDSRASRKDKAKQAENRELILPLLDALKKIQTEKATRATKAARATAKAEQ